MRRKEPFEVHGELICFRVEPRTEKAHGTDSPLIHILLKDDGNLCGGGTVFDAYWLDDLIHTATSLRERLMPAPKKRRRK